MKKLRPVITEWVDETYFMVLALAIWGATSGTLALIIALVALYTIGHS